MFLVQTICRSVINNLLAQKIVDAMRILRSRNIWVGKIVKTEFLLVHQICWKDNFHGQKTIFVLENFVLKYIFGPQNDFSQTILG